MQTCTCHIYSCDKAQSDAIRAFQSKSMRAPLDKTIKTIASSTNIPIAQFNAPPENIEMVVSNETIIGNRCELGPEHRACW
jgi:hypothetical protein